MARKARIDDRVNTVTAAEYLGFARELVVVERDIREATEVLAAAKGVKAGIFRRAKAAGADVEAMKMLASLKRMDDDDRNRLLETTYQYGAWEGVPMWVAPTEETPQGALVLGKDAIEARQGLEDARALSDGYNSRKHGAGTREDNPHIPGSRLYQAWDNGWRDADADMDGKPAPVVQASAAKKPAGTAKRGRPVGSGNAKADDIGDPVGSA